MLVRRRYSVWFILASAALVMLLSCKKSNAVFESMPASVTHIDFTNNLYKRDTFSILYYLYYYNGGGVATGDINNDGLIDIYFTANNTSSNKLYLNKGNFTFEDITDQAGVAGTSEWCTGATMADVNGDGFLDIYVSAVQGMRGLTGKNELFLNNKNGTFTESAGALGLAFSGFGTQAAFFDYDHDGDLDCYLLNHSQRPHQNIKDTSFRREIGSNEADHLLRNDVATTGKFTDVSSQSGIFQSSLGYGLGIAVADFNNDGWEDIYIGNDFHENDYYYMNQRNGTFKECGADHFGHYSRFSMGNDAADINNDGQTDIVTLDMLPPDEKTMKTYGSDESLETYNFKILRNGFQQQVSRNCLQINNGNGTSYSETGLQSGIAATDWSWAPLFADFDNDGNKDLYISSGIVKRPVDLDYVKFVSDLYNKTNNQADNTADFDDQIIEKMPDGASHPFFYKGDGKTHFTDMSNDWGTGKMKGYFNGSAYADLDNDGDLDIITNCIGKPALVLKNTTIGRKSLTISCRSTTANTFGIGTKVYVFQKDQVQYQQLLTTRGFQSSVPPQLHYGLDTANSIDSLLVIWPDQTFEVVKQVSTPSMVLEHKNAKGLFAYASFFSPTTPLLSPLPSNQQALWQHQENPFLDYNVQYLIPHQESTRGPKVAVADVNKDGLEDYFVCGAKSQPGIIMQQVSNGSFKPVNVPDILKDSSFEDIDALFFDANGDQWQDLLVVSGGNELKNDDAGLRDRLYINNGKGGFNAAPQQFPALLRNKGAVAAADIDNDGDTDVFIGVLADAFRYGIVQASYLLINDGKGNFSTAPANVFNGKGLGMVTTAAFADMNNDGFKDLVAAGEFMSVVVFYNKKGVLQPTPIPNSTGIWQTILLSDVNGDGTKDILAGNWGKNTKLFAGKDGPVKLFVKDFDKNGAVEQIVTYTLHGKEYTFLPKDELEKALPVLKKAYLTYGEVAGETVQFMFYDLFKDYSAFSAEVGASSCFFNNAKGTFIRESLPDALQVAPIMAFTNLTNLNKNESSFLAVGNFFGVSPYEGRYDALFPTSFSCQKNATQFTSGLPLVAERGQYRDAKWVQVGKGKKVLVLAQNNAGLTLWKE